LHYRLSSIASNGVQKRSGNMGALASVAYAIWWYGSRTISSQRLPQNCSVLPLYVCPRTQLFAMAVRWVWGRDRRYDRTTETTPMRKKRNEEKVMMEARSPVTRGRRQVVAAFWKFEISHSQFPFGPPSCPSVGIAISQSAQQILQSEIDSY
jgi:hypothetical protein